jgi:thiol-disulfide isomerase/thioredoxin
MTRSPTALLALTLAATLAPGAAGASVHAVTLVLAPEGYAEVFGTLGGQPRVRLPFLRAYDAAGRRFLEITGYDPRFLASLRAIVGRPRPDPAFRLADELRHLRTPAGGPAPDLPPADLTFVKYWAEWCAPCKPQSRDLESFFAERPELRFNLLAVEADTTKPGPGAVGAAPRRRAGGR